MKLSVSLLLCVLIHHGLSAPPPFSFRLPPIHGSFQPQQEPPAHQFRNPPQHQHRLPGPSQLLQVGQQEQHQPRNPSLQLAPPQGNHGSRVSSHYPQQLQHPGPERRPFQRQHRQNGPVLERRPYPYPRQRQNEPVLERQAAPLRMNLGSHPQNHPQQHQHQQPAHMPSQRQSAGEEPAGEEPAGEANVRILKDNIGRYGCGHKDCLNDESIRFDSSCTYGHHVIDEHTTGDGDRVKCAINNHCRIELNKGSVRKHMLRKHHKEIRKVDHRPSPPPDRDPTRG